MSAVRERLAGTAGNNPQTRIYCDVTTADGAGCPSNINPPTGYDAREARKVAKAHGWTRVEGRDYCPAHQCEHGYVPGDYHYDKGTCGRDSSRWCGECSAWGDHHTDRHNEFTV